jgi:hypothetical protein
VAGRIVSVPPMSNHLGTRVRGWRLDGAGTAPPGAP